MGLLSEYAGYIAAVLPRLLKGSVITIQITTTAVFFGIILGTLLAFGKLSKNWLLRVPSMIYIDFVRGTPLFVQILLFYFGIPGLIHGITGEPFRFEPLFAGAVVLSLNSGAYVAEIVRAGIKSVDRGQVEAARSLGMTEAQSMKEVILPQAFKLIVPPLGNEFIVLLKDSSLLAVIGVEELLRHGQLEVARTFAAFPIYIGVALCYLVMTLSIARLVSWSERRLGVSDRSS